MAFLFVLTVLTGCFNFLKWRDDENEPDENEENIEVTRGDFIRSLMEYFPYEYDENYDNSQFTDIEGNSNESYIRIAEQHGIISSENGKFYPNAAATREFASAAAVKSLGYVPELPVQCDDFSDIKEPQYAYLAVDLGMLSLKNNKFLPNDPLTENEQNDILAVVRYVAYSISGPDGNEKGASYNSEVILLDEEESKSTTVDEDTYTVTLPASGKLAELKAGDIIVLNNGYACKILEAQKTDGSVTAKYIIPEIHEVFEYLDVAGTATFDEVEITLADGVVMEEIGDGENPEDEDSFDDSIPLVKATEGTIITHDMEKTYKFTKNFGKNARVDVVINHKINQIDYKFDFEKVDGKTQINDFYLMFDIKDTVSAAIIREKEIKGTNYQGKWNLASFTYGGIRTKGGTFIGAAGYGVDLNIIVSAEGSIMLTCEKTGPYGWQMIDGRIRYVNQMKTHLEKLAVSGSFEVGPELEVSAYILNFKMCTFSLSLTAGITATLKIQDFSPLFYCIDGEFAYRLSGKFAFIGSWCYRNKKEDASLSRTTSWIFGKKDIHCENFLNIVDKCTWDEDDDPPLDDPIDPPIPVDPPIDPDDPNFPAIPDDDPSFPISSKRKIVLKIHLTGTSASLTHASFLADIYDADSYDYYHNPDPFASFYPQDLALLNFFPQFERTCSCGSWWPPKPHNKPYQVVDISGDTIYYRALMDETIESKFRIPSNLSKLYFNVYFTETTYKDPNSDDGVRSETNQDYDEWIIIDIPPNDIIYIDLYFNADDLTVSLGDSSN